MTERQLRRIEKNLEFTEDLIADLEMKENLQEPRIKAYYEGLIEAKEKIKEFLKDYYDQQ